MKYCCGGITLALILAASVGAQGTTVVRGRVRTDSSSQPIAGAIITLTPGTHAAVSDSLGAFRIDGIAAGRYTISVRRIGYARFVASLKATIGDTIDTEFLLTPVAQQLATVKVSGTIANAKLASFEDRRRFGIGHFLNAAEFQKAPGTRLSEKLRGLPGVMVMFDRRRPSFARVATTRGPNSLRIAPCWVSLALDGILVDDYSINWVDPSEVAAIEWYAGPSEVPVQFGGVRSPCGLLMIWTK